MQKQRFEFFSVKQLTNSFFIMKKILFLTLLLGGVLALCSQRAAARQLYELSSHEFNFLTNTPCFTIFRLPPIAKFAVANNGRAGDFQDVFLCDASMPIALTNQSTSSPSEPIIGVKFRYIQFLYGSIYAPPMYGSPPGIEVPSNSTWLAPAATYDMRTVISNMNTTNGFFMLQMQVKTALTTSAWTNAQYFHVQKPPNSAAVADFGFMGSSWADGFATYSCTNAADGELSPIGSSGCVNTDGWLGNGGTLANPIWVGASSMTMGGAAIANVYGGMQSYRVEVWQKNPNVLIGTYPGTGTFFPANGININTEIACGYSPTTLVNFFFSDKLRSAGGATFFNGKIFQAKLIVRDVCGREFTSDDKKGFFKIIPNNANWRNTGKTFEELDAIPNIEIARNELSITPNPAQHQINIAFTSEEDGEGVLSIISVDGKTTQRTIAINAGENTLKESINDLPNGIYFVSLQQKERTLSQKFIKID